jgi:hypothetical protein
MTSVVLLCDEVAVPAEQSVRGDNGRDAVQRCSPHGLRSNRQPAALFVVEAHAPFAQLRSEDPILFDQVVDHILLPALDPPGEGGDEELQEEGVHGLHPTRRRPSSRSRYERTVGGDGILAP